MNTPARSAPALSTFALTEREARQINDARLAGHIMALARNAAFRPDDLRALADAQLVLLLHEREPLTLRGLADRILASVAQQYPDSEILGGPASPLSRHDAVLAAREAIQRLQHST